VEVPSSTPVPSDSFHVKLEILIFPVTEKSFFSCALRMSQRDLLGISTFPVDFEEGTGLAAPLDSGALGGDTAAKGSIIAGAGAGAGAGLDNGSAAIILRGSNTFSTTVTLVVVTLPDVFVVFSVITICFGF
jgi:hypothetical protein